MTVKTHTSAQKLLYIHVGKTAGTSLNNFILEHYPDEKAVVHVENQPCWNDPDKTSDLQLYDFISGHILLPEFHKKMPQNGYIILATFRNPLEHIASHLVWLKNMCSPGKESFLAGHPEWVQEIAHKLWNIDFSSNSDIAAFLSHMTPKEVALLDNTQTRYMVALPGTRRVNNETLSSALKSVQTVDLVGTTECYDEFIALLCATMKWELPAKMERLNVAGNKYGIDIHSKGFAEAVEPVIWADRKLYNAALKKMAQQICEQFFGLNFPQDSPAVTGTYMFEHCGAVIGCLDLSSPARVAGWAMLTNRADVSLVIRLTSKATGSSWLRRACLMRDDLREQGLHPTGACGFVFVLQGDETLAEGDEITVSVLWFNKTWTATVTRK